MKEIKDKSIIVNSSYRIYGTCNKFNENFKKLQTFLGN